MTWLYVALVLVVAAAVAGTAWLKRAGTQAWLEHELVQHAQQWSPHRPVTVTLVADTSAFVASMQRAARAFERFTPRRPCGCPECAEHARDCPDHPANAGAWPWLRWQSRRLATSWHRRRRFRLQDLAARHEWAEHMGRWFR